MTDSARFVLEIIASPDEVDEVNHISNVVYLQWVLRVAQAHSSAAGYDFPAYRELGSVFVVRKHEIEYLKPAFAEDRILLHTWIESWRGASCVRRTSIVRASDEAELARASTLWVMMRLDSGRPTRIPAALVDRFSRPV